MDMIRLLAAVTIVALAAAPGASAHRRFAVKEGVKCEVCHTNPEGGGPRTLLGQYYQATNSVPIDRSPQTMKLVADTVDRWMLELTERAPVIRWSPEILAADTGLDTTVAASDAALLRRMSLDLRGTIPTPQEVARLTRGELTLDAAFDEFVKSPDFVANFMLYHMDIIRPRTGDYSVNASYSRVKDMKRGGRDGPSIWSSDRIPSERSSGDCEPARLVSVSPWWERGGTHKACARTASEALEVTVKGKVLRCDQPAGQQSGACGCGAQMRFCYPDSVSKRVVNSMKEEGARMAMAIIEEDASYGTLLTADWSMHDGGLEVLYGAFDGSIGSLANPDISRPWHRVDRPARHSGILTTPMMLNFFYNGRRWAQRTFESFMCHDVWPDFDLLDDTIDGGQDVAVPYRNTPFLEPSLTVTESRACAACHLQLDGLGKVKDRWDAFGRYHETSPRGLPISESAVFLGQRVDGIDGFGRALASSDVFEQCVVTQAWEHMVGHRFSPSEVGTRAALVRRFKESNQNFKQLLKAITHTDIYRAKATIKPMTRELYHRAMTAATSEEWRVEGRSGWDVYYDKVGGMDYRRIEARDKTPSQGHALVLMKAAAESCGTLVSKESKRERKNRRFIVSGEPGTLANDAAFEANLEALYARALGRPKTEVTAHQRTVLRALYDDAAGTSPEDGWRAVCTAVLSSADFALF